MRTCFLGNAKSPHVRTPAEDSLAQGYEVVLVSIEKSEPDALECLFPPLAAPLQRPFASLTPLKTLWLRHRFFKALDYDIYHAYDASKPVVWHALAAGKHPLVVTVLGCDVMYAERDDMDVSWARRRLIQLVVKHCALVTTRSDPMRKSVLSMGTKPDRIINEPFGVDLDAYTPGSSGALRSRLHLERETKVIFSTRNATPLYNIDLVIRGFASAQKIVCDIHLLVAEGNADPQYLTELKALIKELGIGHSITFMGRLTPSEMIDCYRLADVAVSMAPTDGMPRSLKEALACGTPSVLSPLDRYREIVTEGEHVLFADFDAESVADAIIRLLTDEALAASLSENGLEVARHKADQRLAGQQMRKHYKQLGTPGGPIPPSFLVRLEACLLLIGMTLWRYPVSLAQRIMGRFA